MAEKLTAALEYMPLAIAQAAAAGEFTQYMQEVKEIQDDEIPDYGRLQAIFRGLACREGFNYDNVFDWTKSRFLEDESAECTSI
ncbi:hypothetical protein LTR74_018782, partial [Friedmanniomyces endolithicus]